MSYRTKLRGAVVSSCTATLLAGSGLIALPAQAEPRPTAQVATFFSAYVDAVTGNSSQSPLEVREEYLSTALNTELTLWASTHETDPIYRKNEPEKSFSTTGQAAGALGTTDVYLTMRYEDGTSLNVAYTVRDSDLEITGLRDTPS